MALISVQNLTFGYDGAEENIFENASFQIDTSWHLGLIGRNGRGKSTLLKLIVGEMSSLSGAVRLGSGLTVSYLPQSTDGMCGSLEEYALQNGLDYTDFLTFLRKLNFPRRQFVKRIEQFSAGQKKKSCLRRAFASLQTFMYGTSHSTISTSFHAGRSKT